MNKLKHTTTAVTATTKPETPTCPHPSRAPAPSKLLALVFNPSPRRTRTRRPRYLRQHLAAMQNLHLHDATTSAGVVRHCLDQSEPWYDEFELCLAPTRPRSTRQWLRPPLQTQRNSDLDPKKSRQTASQSEFLDASFKHPALHHLACCTRRSLFLPFFTPAPNRASIGLRRSEHGTLCI